MPTPKVPYFARLLALFEPYRDRRLLRIFLFGILQGLPWVLIGSTMTGWLKEEGITRTEIGLFGLVFSVYSINFLWAPLMDRIYLPVLAKRFGQRRSWVLLMQVLILGAALSLSVLSPDGGLWWMALLCLCVAVSSATQDISLDAFRIESFREEESHRVGPAAAVITAGWWTSFKLGGGLAFYLAQIYQQELGMGVTASWQAVYISLTVLICLTASLLLLITEEPGIERRKRQHQYDRATSEALHNRYGLRQDGILVRVLSWLNGTLIAPLLSFIRRNGAVTAFTLLGFILLFKAGEAFLGRMADVFYLERGFTKAEIAAYSKVFGWVATIVFSFAAGLFSARIGLFRSIVLSGLAMASTNLLFALMAYLDEPHVPLFVFAVVVDQFTTAVATVIFVAFISQLCDRTFSATQYALMASIATFARNSLASLSGAVVDALGGNWALFFVITALMVLPSLLLLFVARRRILPQLADAPAGS